MSDETQGNADTAKTDAKAEKGGSKLVPIMVGVNTLIVGGVLALQFLHPAPAYVKGGEKHEAKAAAKEGEKSEGASEGKSEGESKSEGGEASAETSTAPLGPTVKMPEFVIHLRNPEVDRYARMTFEVEVPSEHEKTDLAAQGPRVRDAFISYLSDRTVEELRGSEGLEKTKQALVQRISAVAPSVHPRALYITDLVIQ